MHMAVVTFSYWPGPKLEVDLIDPWFMQFSGRYFKNLITFCFCFFSKSSGRMFHCTFPQKEI